MTEHGDSWYSVTHLTYAEVTARPPETVIWHSLPFIHPQSSISLPVHSNSWNLLSCFLASRSRDATGWCWEAAPNSSVRNFSWLPCGLGEAISPERPQRHLWLEIMKCSQARQSSINFITQNICLSPWGYRCQGSHQFERAGPFL